MREKEKDKEKRKLKLKDQMKQFFAFLSVVDAWVLLLSAHNFFEAETARVSVTCNHFHIKVRFTLLLVSEDGRRISLKMFFNPGVELVDGAPDVRLRAFEASHLVHTPACAAQFWFVEGRE